MPRLAETAKSYPFEAPNSVLSHSLPVAWAAMKAAIRSFSSVIRLKPPWLPGTMATSACGMRLARSRAWAGVRPKEELLLAAMQHLAAQFAERPLARINRLKETESPVNPRDVIAAILTEALPADDERRTFTVLYTAYFALSLTDPALAIGPLVRNSAAVIDVVAAQLRAGKAAGDTPAHLDPDLEAVSLLAMSAGLGTSVLVGQSSAGQAQAVIDYHLHRLFPHLGQRYAGCP